jgi:Holliday junction resolvase RusA-like endonuclease
MMEMSFVVPGAPVPKARARVSVRKTKSGKTLVRAHTPKRTADYEMRVGMFARTARPRGWPTRCEYCVSFTAYIGEDRGDIDNHLKSVLDGAQEVLWDNDKSVRRLGPCALVRGATNPLMEVVVTALPVKCSRDACTVETLYPDDDGRCPACPVQHRAKPLRRKP